jgi:hypothetical protein
MLAGELKEQLNVRRSIRLVRNRRTTMPMTWGLFHPVILLPQGADEWPDERKRCVLAHEIAHVWRWDCLTQGLAQVACALVWWNPLCWVGARRMCIERELACDDHVLACDTQPSEYATHLLEVARRARRSFVSPLNAVSMAHPSQLEGRILAILDPNRRRSTLGKLSLAMTLGLAVLLVVPVAALRPVGSPDSAEASAPTVVTVAEASPDLLEWTGTVAPDAAVTIDGNVGDVYVGSSAEGRVHVRGYRAAPHASSHVRVMEDGNALLICTTTAADAMCDVGDAVDRRPASASHPEAQIDLKVLVPSTVRLRIRTSDGNISVAEHGQVVTAETQDGDVSITTTGYAQARTGDGDISVKMGRTDWSGKLDLETQDGDVEVILPAHPDVEVYAEAQNGRVRSDYDLKVRRRAAGMLLWGSIGKGDRRLTLRTQDGAIALRSVPSASEEGGITGDPLWDTVQGARETVRVRVVEVLGRERDPSSVSLLSILVQRDESAKVRKTAAWALGEIGARGGIDALAEALLQDEDAGVRAKAAWALGEVRHPKAGPGLADAVRHDPDATVRTLAVWALGEIRDERAIPVLRTALEDPSERVREKARWALRELGSTVAEQEVHVERSRSVATAPHTEERTISILRSALGQQLTLDRLEDPALLRRILSLAKSDVLDQQVLARLVQGEGPGPSGAYRRAMRAAGVDTDDAGLLLLSQVIGVEPHYVRAVRAAGFTFCLEEMMTLYMMDVSVRDLRAMSASGYGDLDPEAIGQLHLQGIDGAYLRALANVGYRSLCPDDLVAWRQHGVDGSFLREMAAVGYRNLKPEEVLALRIHDIDGQFVREHIRPGEGLPPIAEIVRMKIVDA